MCAMCIGVQVVVDVSENSFGFWLWAYLSLRVGRFVESLVRPSRVLYIHVGMRAT